MYCCAAAATLQEMEPPSGSAGAAVELKGIKVAMLRADTSMLEALGVGWGNLA